MPGTMPPTGNIAGPGALEKGKDSGALSVRGGYGVWGLFSLGDELHNDHHSLCHYFCYVCVLLKLLLNGCHCLQYSYY